MHIANSGAQAFSSLKSPQEIEEIQTSKVNEAWQIAQSTPFYHWWKKQHDLPSNINSISDLHYWPTLTKDVLRERQDLIDLTPNTTGSYVTSGSTSEPFHFPKGAGEVEYSYSSAWSYRINNGLLPFDPFLHTANTLSGAATSRSLQLRNRAIRAVRDILGNSWKVNGFIPTPEDADEAIKAIQFTRPRYIVGFTSAIASISRRANERGLQFPYLTHAILTSETIEEADIRDVRSFLKVRVLIEYGAIEVGVVGGTPSTSQDWPIQTNWHHTLLRTDEKNSAIVSTLSPRVFPLINYHLGDRIRSGKVTNNGSILAILDIEGRSRDIVDIAVYGEKTRPVAAREIVNLIRDIPGIISVQISQPTPGQVDALIVAPRIEPDKVLSRMSASISRNHPEFITGAIGVIFMNHHIAGARGKKGLMVDPSLVPETTERMRI